MKIPETSLNFIGVTYSPLMEKHVLMLTSLFMSNMCLTMWLTTTTWHIQIISNSILPILRAYLRLGVLYKVNQCVLTIHTPHQDTLKLSHFYCQYHSIQTHLWQYRNSDLTILSISNILSEEIKDYQYTFYTTC